jgi:hypothetical protein
MEIFDSLINEVTEIIEPYSKTEFSYEKENSWEDVGHNQVILQKETLFELDGVPEDLARQAFTLAAAKLSVQTTFVTKAVL